MERSLANRPEAFYASAEEQRNAEELIASWDESQKQVKSFCASLITVICDQA